MALRERGQWRKRLRSAWASLTSRRAVRAKKLLAQRQNDLDGTLEELEAKRAELERLPTLELVYGLSDASYLAGWYREWSEHKLEDRQRYIMAMALVEDILEILDAREGV